ncbi:hypothetical protein [Halorubrum laminariae]|uniref:Uncharacterized protein n=1 Tax=Halorubrum laminariae TaxID=1433523 RepID=A0ABD6BWI3_9EURY|nr:hypothetical protein [Halorubrum laminariae]
MAAEVESTQVFQDWVISGIAAYLLVVVFEKAVTINTPDVQKRVLTSVAVANGIVIGIGLAPMTTIAAQLVPLSTLFNSEYVDVVSRIVQIGTVLELLFGVVKMVDGSGWVGALAFLGAFLGGIFLPYQETSILALILIFICLVVVEATPSDFWKSG